ncbi:N-acetylglucosamine kinase [Psychromicrobium xiongbiense]|uniref:N-acetylglucosamine kinase n=1 Tax=Psychromicrobium xiongbiense TaxID=3051184 RepID=UPI002555A552|nr:BadF/BadG/BcrA/BcrD ATPase family protein [Psychromicrobium sp. YIM S02556]
MLGDVNATTQPAAAAPQAIIGLDIGGSKTRGILWVDGNVVVDHEVGSANVQNVSVDQAAANLAELFAALLADFSPKAVARVFAGSGGIDTEADAEALAGLIRPLAPGVPVVVVHDTRLLLAAGHAVTGVAVIAGTGSAAWGTNEQGEEARAGGWGYLLGDEGSGYWFGREAVRHSLHRMNLGLAPDQLTQALLAHCGLREPGELIAHFHSGTSRRYWAATSPVVFNAAAAGHEESLAMIAQAGEDLAAMAAQVAHQLGLSGPIVLGSGLGMHQPSLQQAFRERLATRGYHEVRVLDQDPIFGVLDLASADTAS